MEDSNYKSDNIQDRSNSNSQAKIKECANELLNESKKLANEMYQQGKETVGEKVNDAEEYIRDYSDKLINKIQTNPLSSVLLAVGVGMLLSTLLKK